MRTWTYRIEGQPGVKVQVSAIDSRGASVASAEFAMRNGFLLVGPLELRHEPIYRRRP